MKTQKELKNNPWADAHKYADNKYHMEQGDDVSKYERYEEVKEAFEAGYRQALEDYANKKYTKTDIRKAIKFGQTMELLEECVPIPDFINSLNR
jgi:hypothetical protein